ncbi:FkbM family methyltransferase [Pseudobutyrivibrio ruminis]|uniref:Methyltransferase, FkbM family n=1 Tax=Pseudobutyrivibrio ruminis DSM 9787 TaxID=1123011 RepID=A0A285RW40_9FIRM|nr:FkbM family methyltransferase [Pseudobutyrivibrio ruminis]SOB98387.1 methyltransferase, FkbM family [Pseudobutyrivibrio ruminis DSM 9787]
MQEISRVLGRVDEIRRKMVDDESKVLFDARLRFMFDKDFYEFSKAMFSLERKWIIPYLDKTYNFDNDYSEIVLWGCGKDGRHVRSLLARSKYASIPISFVTNNMSQWGQTHEFEIDNLNVVRTPIISPEELRSRINNAVIIISSIAYRCEIMDQLGSYGAKMEQIVYPFTYFGYRLYGERETPQYFDLFEANSNEIFLDVGANGGGTATDFVKWCGEKGYKAIYSFEAHPRFIDITKEYFKNNNLHDAEVVPIAAWDKKDTLDFSISLANGNGGCHVMESANLNSNDWLDASVKVPADTIDNVLSGKPATFIKMDIEGSEYKALVGAEKTIKKYKPRMAISIYHKPEDIVMLPYIISQYNPDYKFALRQYHSGMWETILYCF